MEYVATSRGYRLGSLVEVGESFEADDFKGSWAVPKGDYKPGKPKDEDALITEAREALQGRRASPQKRKKSPGKAKAPE